MVFKDSSRILETKSPVVGDMHLPSGDSFPTLLDRIHHLDPAPPLPFASLAFDAVVVGLGSDLLPGRAFDAPPS